MSTQRDEIFVQSRPQRTLQDCAIFHGIAPPTMVGLTNKTRILLVTSIEDYVDTSSERDWPLDEFGVHSKATTLEHLWVRISKVPATASMTLTKPASTLFKGLIISPWIQTPTSSGVFTFRA